MRRDYSAGNVEHAAQLTIAEMSDLLCARSQMAMSLAFRLPSFIYSFRIFKTRDGGE